jgi:hypothetical protein
MFLMLRQIIFYFAVLSLVACAQVPKESVELSTTVGRDISIVYKSHRELAKILFDRMKRDVNRFIDNVYAPYQIKAAMEADFKASKSANEEERKSSILLGINSAFKPEATEQLQRNVYSGMGIMFSVIREDVEAQRKELLDQLNEQESSLLLAIDRNYSQIIYGNSIVTGYLSSVVKVHDAQNEILKALGVDKDLSTVIGKRLAEASDKVSDLVQKSESANTKISDIESSINKLKSAISGK